MLLFIKPLTFLILVCSFIEIFSNLLKDRKNVLDPFAGTGKISLIKNHGYNGKIICNEMEPEFSKISEYLVD